MLLLYIDEEIEGVSIISFVIKNDSILKSEVNFFEVSLIFEENN